jgi:hypothetical protein
MIQGAVRSLDNKGKTKIQKRSLSWAAVGVVVIWPRYPVTGTSLFQAKLLVTTYRPKMWPSMNTHYIFPKEHIYASLIRNNDWFPTQHYQFDL